MNINSSTVATSILQIPHFFFFAILPQILLSVLWIVLKFHLASIYLFEWWLIICSARTFILRIT